MLFVEWLALIALLGGGVWGMRRILEGSRRSDERQRLRQQKSDQMHNDLRKALASRDYRQLDDFLILYNEMLSADIKRHITVRRDELFIEQNP